MPSGGVSSRVRRTHLGDLLIANPTRCARTRFVVKPVKTPFGKPAPPFAYRVRRKPKTLDNRLVLKPRRRKQHNPSPLRKALTRLAPTTQALKLTTFFHTQVNRNSTPNHNQSSLSKDLIIS